MQTKSSPILVTGGAGFIGTHLCRALLADGRRVRVLDWAPPPPWASLVDYIRADIADPEAMTRALENAEAVVHLAAYASVPYCHEFPVESHRVNVHATVQLAELVYRASQRASQWIPLLFASSCAVYGPASGVLNEVAVASSTPLSLYALWKLAGEQALCRYAGTRDFPALALRFFNVFGPGQSADSPYSGVIALFSRAAREGRPLLVHGDGTQTRDFISVHDVVKAIVAAIRLPRTRYDGTAINVGSGRSVTIRSLAELVSAAVGTTPSIELAPARSGDIPHSQADIARARSLLAWSPSVTLEHGLAEILSY